MAAAYPTGIASFINKVNVTDIIDASHPNSLQDEVVATQTTLGTEPNRSTSPSSSGTFNATSNLFSTVGARLNNLEVGVVSDAHTQYLRKAGDTANVITIGASTTKGLVVRGASSQSANLLEFQNSSSTVLSAINSAGAFVGAVTPPDLAVNEKTSGYTVALADKNNLISVNSSSNLQITVPANSTTAFPAGSQINIFRRGTGTVQIVGAGTAVIVGTPGFYLRARYSSATLIKLDGADNWALVGDLSLA
jgi:hypothetical protein